MFTALLDTCVLWPSLQRDVLLSLAAEGMYRPAWSSIILAELEYEQAAKLIRRGVNPIDADHRAAHLIQQMRQAFNDAEITGWEGLDGIYGLPDPDDEHVVAAAVVAGAGAIITLNTKDFPATLLPRLNPDLHHTGRREHRTDPGHHPDPTPGGSSRTRPARTTDAGRHRSPTARHSSSRHPRQPPRSTTTPTQQQTRPTSEGARGGTQERGPSRNERT